MRQHLDTWEFSRESDSALIGFVALPQLSKALASQAWTTELLASATNNVANKFRTIVLRNTGTNGMWDEDLRSWKSGLVVRGQLISIDKGSQNRAREVSRRFLCAGFSDLRQEILGRRIVTSAMVSSATQ